MAKKKSETILPHSKKPKSRSKSSQKTANMNLYSSLAYRHRTKAEEAARVRARELAKLPKDPWKRFCTRLKPKNVYHWFFSKRGQKQIWKFIAACVLIGIIILGALFLYYKKDLDTIRLDEMQISDTVNTYLDRNGTVLWQDTGSDNYRLTVEADEISPYMYQATVAIEDKNFYNHAGVDPSALVRATFSTLTGQGVQGGSTLTQQLIKQVYFSDEAASENRGGLTRKIKELILSIELEKMYTKDQILTMYLNESPYGGRRNGVESAARTYFGKSAKDLTLAESALLAAIPNNPAILNPYNTYGNDLLIERQHKVLDDMVGMGYITEQEANDAKSVAILDTIKPESDQYANALAPHFVLEVKSQLEEKYGISTMREGGWTIKTTLDYRAQQIAEEAVAAGMSYASYNNSDNAALVSLDVETSQVIAMVGSADFSNAVYGEQNVTTDSLIEPGSSIKPILDFTPLFMEREGTNYGPGSILRDENIDRIYCAGYTGGSCSMTNATGTFYGNVTIRFSLGHSLNIAAVKALYINGVDNSLEIAHKLGDVSYCDNQETNYGLSIAIGSGCGVRMVEHANAYASLARGGSYKDVAYVLELKNSSGDVIESWSDSEAERVVDEQIAYMISNILSDGSARFSVYAPGGSQSFGYVIPDVWTAAKTGTTTTSNSAVTKDSLMESYSTAISTFVWNGNHDGSGLSSNSNIVPRNIIGNYMERVHKEVYEPDGKWNYGDQPAQPSGIQTLTVNGIKDIWPSWYNTKNSGVSTTTMTFNKYNHLLAASCTPEDAKIEVTVTKTTDPLTKKEVYTAPAPYDYNTSDTCDYTGPQVAISQSGTSIIASVQKGSNDIASYTLYVNGVEKGAVSLGSNGVVNGYTINCTESSIKLVVTDSAGYSSSSEMTPVKTACSSEKSESDKKSKDKSNE